MRLRETIAIHAAEQLHHDGFRSKPPTLPLPREFAFGASVVAADLVDCERYSWM